MSETKQKNTWETIVLIILVVAIAVDYYVLIQHQIKIKELERARISAERAQRTMNVLEERYCKGIWSDNQCLARTCVDSDIDADDPLTTKGQVTYIDESGNEQVVSDECLDGKNIKEMTCVAGEDDNYLPSEETATCPLSCNNGACSQ
ncbi:MAG: hypothetical protein V1652_01195 [bacterium]